MWYVALGVAYCMVAFVISALVVRIAPTSSLGIQLRRHLALFPLVPVALLGWVAVQPLKLFSRKRISIRHAFEAISGRRQHVPYNLYGVPRDRREKVDRSQEEPAE